MEHIHEPAAELTEPFSGGLADTGNETARWAREVWDWIKAIFAALVIVLLAHQFLFHLSTVKGSSMEPTLHDGEWLVINKLVYLTGHPHYGDVIILRNPLLGAEESHEFLVKRVVGLPGDTIEVRNHHLYRNGALVHEQYAKTPIGDEDCGPYIITKGHYFVMGDNRHASASLDSRAFGEVPESIIEGRADFIVWPFTKLGKL